MTRDEAVARIQQGLGFRSDRTTECQNALLEAQRNLEKGKTLPKFLLSEDQTLTLTSGSSSVALPANFLRRHQTIPITYVPLDSTVPREIPWRDYERARMSYQFDVAQAPKVCALRQSSIYFTPIADRDYTLTWTYYKKGTLLSTNIENEWLADDNMPEYLIGAAGLSIAKDIRNQAAIAIFSQMLADSRAALYSETVQEEADDSITMGGDS